MRLIDADKLYPDCLTKEGKLAIRQSQIAEAPTVEVTKLQSYVMGFCDGLKTQTREKSPVFEEVPNDDS